MDVINPVKLNTPDPDLKALSFCASNAAAIADWTAGLPMANTKQTAMYLLGATEELARWQCSAAERLEVLEVLRPTLEYICTRLDSSSSAVGSADGGENLTKVAQRLQTNLTLGYKAVIRDSDPSKTAQRDTIILACHRTVADLSRTLLRSCQHYVAPSDNLWLELNQIYALAERLGFAKNKVNDDENHSVLNMSIESHYVRSLLLATAKPNQLRHRQLGHIFNALEHWVTLVTMSHTPEDSLFAVQLDSDEPPCYTRLLGGNTERDALRGMQTGKLVLELENFLKKSASKLTIPEYVEAGLINHLISCWGEIAKRGFRRAPATGIMKVAVGMSASHYYISGGVDFAKQLGSSDAILRTEINPFLLDKASTNPTAVAPDVWDRRIPENPNVDDPSRILMHPAPISDIADDAADKGPDNRHRAYDVHILDTSPGGYRLEWAAGAPTTMQTGDIMAVREESDQRWCIAVLRWVKHEDGLTQTGLELIAPRAIPVAIRIIQKKGGPTDFIRALVLPELSAIRQPATLITPALQFKSQQKIHLQREGVQSTAQIADERMRTESFTQFTFRMLDGYLEKSSVDLTMNQAWTGQGPSASDSVSTSH